MIKKTFIYLILSVCHLSSYSSPSDWDGDLDPMPENYWNEIYSAHLLERAGFGGTPDDIKFFSSLTMREAVDYLINYDLIEELLPKYKSSPNLDHGIDPFPPSRPAATNQAKAEGKAIGVLIKPDGNRRLQQVADRFLYWLRASRLETQRYAYWWANRMLNTKKPLQEKMTLFWHGHFATSEEKVRDYRKIIKQNQMFREKSLSNFKDLLFSTAKDPAMLAYLDAAANVKGAPNENFAREIMELFSMGVGNYTEHDIKEAARAFTGWNFNGTDFVFNKEKYDGGNKKFLDKSGNFDGEQIIDIILEQEVTAEFLASKIYQYFVKEEISNDLKYKLGKFLRSNSYDIKKFLYLIFLSKDFYSTNSVSTRIKPPVELVINTYKKMGLFEIPGIPDFNEVTYSMGQKLFFPPNVAGWTTGRSWITPGLLITRSNFVFDTVFPSINFKSNDRVAGSQYQIGPVEELISMGMNITTATKPQGKKITSLSSQADRDEAFNTRFASYRAWRKAIEKVIPIPRVTAQINLSKLVIDSKCETTSDVVNYFVKRFISVQIDTELKKKIILMLSEELGTSNISEAKTYMEEALRNTLHVILSLPAYQLG